MNLQRKATVIALLLAASTYAGMAQQSPNGVGPRDDAYVSTHQPKVVLGDPNEPIKDDPVGRRESFREQMGGDLTPEFMAALMAASDAERAKYGPAGRGAIGVAGGAAWTTSGRTGPTSFRTASRSRSPTLAGSARFSCIPPIPTSSTC